jgi:NADH-quinone oxidoreductase subunit J
MQTASYILFWILALISIGSALMVVLARNPVRSALFLVVTFLAIAVFYVTLSAQFLAAVQVMVYAGAIMVLFLFVIMLLNLSAPEALKERGTIQRPIALALGAVFITALIFSQALLEMPSHPAQAADVEKLGTVQTIGLSLYNPNLPWLFPFEITSILLLIAVIGAIVLAKRKLD